MVDDLESEAPDLSEYDWPKGDPGDERPDPLFDSMRGYVEQVGVYKQHQGKSVEDRRKAANKARYQGGNAAAVRRYRERQKARRLVDGPAP